SPRDWDAKGRLGRRDSEIARQRDGAPAARSHTLHLSDCRFVDALQPLQHSIDGPFVVESVLRIVKGLKLSNVRPRNEGLATGAPQNQHPNARILVGAIAGIDSRLRHLPGPGISGLGSVEGERGNGAREFVRGMSGGQGFLRRVQNVVVSCWSLVVGHSTLALSPEP